MSKPHFNFGVSIVLSFIAMIFSSCFSPEVSPPKCQNSGRVTAQQLTRPKGWEQIKKVFLLVLENENADEAFKQNYIRQLSKRGASLSQSYAITHPSQPNYIALTSGSNHGVTDNNEILINVKNIVDLLEEKELSWKAYAEDYPGNCFLGNDYRHYVKRHLPFLGYKNIARSTKRCRNVLPATELQKDVDSRSLPEFSLYIPNNLNNGHDTSASYSDQWLRTTFDPLLNNPNFIENTLFILTYDESETEDNLIFTLLYGAGVQEGATSQLCYDHYSLLATIESILDLGTLGNFDEEAPVITEIWKK